MRLNLDGRIELRELVESKLISAPAGIKIKLPKDVLEELLFEKVEYKGTTIKYPVFYGTEYLSKLDLSEVDFEDVAWSAETIKLAPASIQIHYINPHIDYSYTNAHIDFSKSWEAKNSADGKASIDCCSFRGTNLSNNDLSIFSKIANSDLSSTSIRVESITPLLNAKAYNSSFDYIDFVNETVTWPDFSCLATCSFRKTRLNVKFEKKTENLFLLSSMISTDKLGGCYVNDHYLPTREELAERKVMLQNQYEKIKAERLEDVSDSITEQTRAYQKSQNKKS